MIRAFVLLLLLPLSALHSQRSYSVELSSGFPLKFASSSPRNYFTNAHHSATLALRSNPFSESILTVTATRQSSVAPAITTPVLHSGALSQIDATPFTSDAQFNEYGLFAGVRFSTAHPLIRAFVQTQFGITVTPYTGVRDVSYIISDPMPGDAGSVRSNEKVIGVGGAAMYGCGVQWSPVEGFSLTGQIYAVDHLTRHEADAYRSIGVRFEL